MMEKQRRENYKQTLKNHAMAFDYEGFDSFYKSELIKDSKRDPRPINE